MTIHLKDISRSVLFSCTAFALSWAFLYPVQHARAAEVTMENAFPMILSASQLTLNSVQTELSKPQMLSSASASSAQIEALTRLLEQLISIYQALLVSQDSGNTDDDDHWITSDLPDLKVVSLSPTTVVVDEMTTYKATIKNVGGDTVRSFNVNMGGTDVRAASIRSGKTTSAKGSWGFSTTGVHEVCIPVDIWDVIDESNETNNSSCFDIEVVSRDSMEDEDPEVFYDFSYDQRLYGDPGEMNIDFEYTIQNYHRGLVLDVELEVNCDDTYIAPTFRRDCSRYLFDLSGKAAESYEGVLADPFVKGGASYRFTGMNGHLYITGFSDPSYVPEAPYIHPVPDNIDLTFILRDLDANGRTIWSTKKTAQFKG